eukprot:14886398-Alexandrium_andersonii.AAC.1
MPTAASGKQCPWPGNRGLRKQLCAASSLRVRQRAASSPRQSASGCQPVESGVCSPATTAR